MKTVKCTKNKGTYDKVMCLVRIMLHTILYYTLLGQLIFDKLNILILPNVVIEYRCYVHYIQWVQFYIAMDCLWRLTEAYSQVKTFKSDIVILFSDLILVAFIGIIFNEPFLVIVSAGITVYYVIKRYKKLHDTNNDGNLK